jgi:DNA-3-methyladenine glycosylase I
MDHRRAAVLYRVADHRISVRLSISRCHDALPVTRDIGDSLRIPIPFQPVEEEPRVIDEAARVRCPWSEGVGADYRSYHDTEWGVPVHDDRRHFEFLVLEGAQAGLSWSTILHKRANYRRAFADFDAARVARFNRRSVSRLLRDPGIVRNRLKVESAIGNARAFLSVQEEFGSFDAYVWRFVDGAPIVNRWRSQADVPPRSERSDALSKDLKSRGFKFVGTTIIYAHMQATGLVNDHLVDCFRYRCCR